MAFLTVGSGKEYTYINDAISYANSGDVLLVYPGEYSEQVVINKFIHLRAESKNQDVIISSPAPISKFYDSFESGTLDNWSFSGDADWVITTSGNGYNSAFAAQSGFISDNQSSCIYRTINFVDVMVLSFYWKVSSENNYDWLSFYIDNIEQPGKISGTVDWEFKTFILSAGSHVLKWCYSKDGSNFAGNDCGWLDNVTISTFINKIISIDYCPEVYEDIYIEGFSIIKNSSLIYSPIYIDNSNDNLGIYLNKCNIFGSIDSSGIINLNNKLLNSFFIKYCCMTSNGFAYITNADWNKINKNGIIYSQIDSNYLQTGCVGNLMMLNVVTKQTYNYGCTYGQYYYDGEFSGFVYKQGNPVSRKLYLHDRTTGELLATTISSDNGYYSMKSFSIGPHYIVCLDNNDKEYNDLIIGNLFPTVSGG